MSSRVDIHLSSVRPSLRYCSHSTAKQSWKGTFSFIRNPIRPVSLLNSIRSARVVAITTTMEHAYSGLIELLNGPSTALTITPASDNDTTILSPLLALPGELRNIIYRLLLTSVIPTRMRRRMSQSHGSAPQDGLPLVSIAIALLSTCKQVYAEASPILYSENMFSAHPSLLISLPCLVNPSRQIRTPELGTRIRRWYIGVRLDTDARFKEEDATVAFSGAEELEIDASEAMFRTAGVKNLMLFQGVRGVGRAKVHGSVERNFAAWLERSMMTPIGMEVYPSGVEFPDPWRNGNR